MKRIFFILILVAATMSQSFAESGGTPGFIAYLSKLLELRIIGDKELVILIEAFEKGRLVNPIPHLDSPSGPLFTESVNQVHYEGLQNYLQKSSLDPRSIVTWAESQLKEVDQVRERRERARVATLEIFQKMEFHAVQAAEPFELMSTLVTQKQWAMIMGDNPAKFIWGEATVEINLGGNRIFMQPDHPVEQVSWNDTQEFLKKLNQMSLENDPVLAKLIVDFTPGDRFQLPTEAQWLEVANNHGQAKGDYFFGNQVAELAHYAWYVDNSQGTTHPVASLRPFVVDGHEFYDILGNVREWMEDWGEEDYYPESNNPCLEKFSASMGVMKRRTRIEHTVRGGRWAASAENLKTANTVSYRANFRSDGVGFRLVRIRAKQ